MALELKEKNKHIHNNSGYFNNCLSISDRILIKNQQA